MNWAKCRCKDLQAVELPPVFHTSMPLSVFWAMAQVVDTAAQDKGSCIWSLIVHHRLHHHCAGHHHRLAPQRVFHLLGTIVVWQLESLAHPEAKVCGIPSSALTLAVHGVGQGWGGASLDGATHWAIAKRLRVDPVPAAWPQS